MVWTPWPAAPPIKMLKSMAISPALPAQTRLIVNNYSSSGPCQYK